jgi:hypothetical protein
VVVSSSLAGDTFGPNQASVHAFHMALGVCAALVAAGGIAGALGIRNQPHLVDARDCAGGQLAGVPGPAAQAE